MGRAKPSFLSIFIWVCRETGFFSIHSLPSHVQAIELWEIVQQSSKIKKVSKKKKKKKAIVKIAAAVKDCQAIHIRKNNLINFYETHDCKAGPSRHFVQEKYAKIFNRRLGHINFHDTKKLHVMNLITNVNQGSGNVKCRDFYNSNFFRNRSKEIMDLIHRDVCGPAEVKSLTNKRYFQTFFYDYSKYS